MLTNDVDGIPDMARVWTMDLVELTMEPKPFARGAFGHVYKGEYFGTPVCVKILKNEDPNERASSFKLIQREVTSLKFGHPNLVQFMGAAEKGDEIYIITEYIHGGNLRQYIKDDRVHIPWALRTQIGKDISCGMAYLHSKGIIHRDLKSKNLLVGDNWRIKICDFGFARSVSRRQLMTVCGTGEWMAPEVIQGVDYDEKADVYSFGIVLCELITRRKATDDLPRSPTDFSLDVTKLMPLVPEDCPPALINLAISCVAHDPYIRPAFKEITRTLQAMLASLTPTPASYPRPSSFTMLCSQSNQQQQQLQQNQNQHEEQVQVTPPNPKERVQRAHARTSPQPYTPTSARSDAPYHNNFNHTPTHIHWANEGEGFVNVTGGSPSARGVVWSDNWEGSSHSSVSPLFVSNRLTTSNRKQLNGSPMITPSKNKKEKDTKSPPASPPPILFASPAPLSLFSFTSTLSSHSSSHSNPNLSTHSSHSARQHSPTVHTFSPTIPPAGYTTAQFHLLNTSSHSTRNTNAPHLASSPPKMHEKFSINNNAMALSR